MMSGGNEFKKGHTYMQWMFALLANATVLAYGMECGWISPTTKILQSDYSPTGYRLSDSMVSWIASSMSIAAVFGVSIYSYIADKFGRKIGIILIAVPEAISWVMKLSYTSTTTLIIARVLTGVAAGGCFNIVPMYVKEISQDNIRGILGTFPMLMTTTGMLIMFLLGAYLDYTTVIIVALSLPIITLVMLVKAPESPAFLVKQGKIDEATKTVAFLRGLEKDDKIIQSVIEGMKNEEAHFKSLPNMTLVRILKDKSWRRGFLLIITIFLFHGLNGAYAIMTYASAILISTGVEFDISPDVQTISFPIAMIISSLALAAVVERYGRKPLLIGSFLITSISMTTIAVLMIVQEQGGSVPNWLPVVAIILAMSMYGGGVSPLPYIIITEMFSFQIRAKVVGAVVTFAWFQSFLLLTIYAPMVNYLGPYSPFIFYAITNLAGAIFASIFLPETKGKSEEEIQQLLLGRAKECNVD